MLSRTLPPPRPGNGREDEGERAKTEPRFTQSKPQQIRHESTRGDNADADAHEDGASGKARREGVTCDSTVGAASNVSAPPETPAAKRQTKNQAKPTGKAQAKNVTDASNIMPLSVATFEIRFLDPGVEAYAFTFG